MANEITALCFNVGDFDIPYIYHYLYTSVQYVNGPTHFCGHTLDWIIVPESRRVAQSLIYS